MNGSGYRAAKTSLEIRHAIRGSSESLNILAKRYGINPKTVAKWKKREILEDLPRGPKLARSTKLTPQEEAIIVSFRKHTWLSLDDCLYVLEVSIRNLTRSSLYRCLKRHGLQKIDTMSSDSSYYYNKINNDFGAFYIDVTKLATGAGFLYIYVATDLLSKFSLMRVFSNHNGRTSVAFLIELIEFLPYAVKGVLTDNNSSFSAVSDHVKLNRKLPMHIFGMCCSENNIEHQIIDAHGNSSVRDCGTADHEYEFLPKSEEFFRTPAYFKYKLEDFFISYNYERRLKALEGLTPFEYICRAWSANPGLFRADPTHHIPKPIRHLREKI